MNGFRNLLASLLLIGLTTSVLAINLSESFNDTFFPPVSWQSLETGDGTNIWHRASGFLHAYDSVGSAQISEEDVAGTAQRWLISPKLHINNLTDSLTFWAKATAPMVLDNDSLFVLLSTTDSATGSFTTEIAHFKCGSGGAILDSWARRAYALDAYLNQDVYIAFVHRDEGNGGNEVNLDWIGGPELLAAPDRAALPTPADLAVGVLAFSNLSWTNGDGTSTIDLYLAQTVDSINNNEAIARKITNQNVSSYDPPDLLTANQQFFWKIVTRNAYGDTQGPVWSFTVSGPPLNGDYDIGGGANHYATFTAAHNALYGNGVAGPVIFHVYGTDYEERLDFVGAIPGASATNRVTFTDQSGTARILDSTATTSSVPVVQLNGADYLTFDGIDIWASGETDICVTLLGGSTDNIFRDADYTSHSASTVSHSVRMLGLGNNNNLFHNLNCSQGNTGFNLTAVSDAGSSGNIVEQCTISLVKIGISISHQANLHIRYNDIQLNWTASSDARFGLDVTSNFGANSSVDFYGNKVHNLLSSSASGSGMVRQSGVAGSTVRVYNNFLWDLTITGTGQIRGVNPNGPGNIDIYNNSFRLNDVTSTGTQACIYISASTPVERIKNNIFYNAETTALSRAIFGSSATNIPNELDYNVYYNSGGAAYQVYDAGASDFVTLANLITGTTFEDAGLEGNPGYFSSTNLHINPLNNFVSNNGLSLALVTHDIDNNVRGGIPDRGADEFDAIAPPNDYAVLSFVGALPLYPEFSAVPVNVRLQNRGSAAQTNVPVRLFYDGAQVAELLVSLAVDEIDTIQFTWNTGVSAPDTNALEAQSFLTGDSDPTNDSAFVNARIVGQPLTGQYDLGGGDNNFATFTSAATDLVLRGISGAVTFNVYANTYNESFTLPAIQGASATNTITFRQQGALATPPEIVSATTPAVSLNGADYVTFDNIDISLTVTGRVVQITNNADFNTIKNCTLTGATVATTTNHGVSIIGGGNDGNLIQNVTISGAHFGVRMAGVSGSRDVGNEVDSCTVLEGRYAVSMSFQNGGRVHDCNLQPGWATAATEVSGVYDSTHASGDTTFAYNNRIHNIRTSSISNGIQANTSANGRLIAYNNFISDFQVTGTGALYGLRTAGGNSEFYYNSVRINDVGTTGNIYAFYLTGASNSATGFNNVLQVDESNEECWSIYRASGSLSSDNNAVYGTGSLYNAGFDGANFPTIDDWYGSTGRDGSSVQGEPGFLDNTNLHISPTFGLLNAGGIATALVSTDIDGQTRGNPPDIGADEYAYNALAHDFSVNMLIDVNANYPAGLLTNIEAEVQNFGTSAETAVPIRLFYNGVQQSEFLLGLLPGVVVNVSLPWTPPTIGFQTGQLEVQAFLATDLFHDNDSSTANVVVYGGPMSGVYDLGGGNMDFATFNEAVTSLNLRGIDGEVTIDCFDGTYNENIVLTPITGATLVDRVIFQAHPSALTDVVILANSSATNTILIDGADFITIKDLNIVNTNVANYGVNVTNDADYIELLGLTVSGRDSNTTATRGIAISRDFCNNALVDGCTISGCYYGVNMFEGNSSNESPNVEISNNHITGGNYCIFLDNSPNARCHHNHLEPKGADGVDAQGILVESQNAGDTVFVYNNTVTNLRRYNRTTAADLSGIQVRPGSSAGPAYIYNNMI